MTADAHGHAFAYASTDHVSHRSSAQIVKDQFPILQIVAGPLSSTICAVFVYVDSLIAFGQIS